MAIGPLQVQSAAIHIVLMEQLSVFSSFEQVEQLKSEKNQLQRVSLSIL